MPTSVTVYKLDLQGRTVVSYAGELIERGGTEIVLQAIFGRERMALGYVTLKPGDRFVEHFYTQRWYNIFAVYDADGGELKGWYCNITRPAQISGGETPADPLEVRAVDLALDYFVKPAGDGLVLDQDEFDALPLEAYERLMALEALEELRGMAARRAGPFAYLPGSAAGRELQGFC